MSVAAAAERHKLGLLLAPACQGVGPLPRTAHLIRFLAACDHPAVDDTRDDR